MIGRFSNIGMDADKVSLVVITGSLLVIWSLMLSQAMETVTRAFYARSDLDLILTSPAAARKIFAVRITTVALSTVLMAIVLASPFINVLAARGGLRWLGTSRSWCRSASPRRHSRLRLRWSFLTALARSGPSRRADSGGGNRRSLRNWGAGGRDHVLWDTVAL